MNWVSIIGHARPAGFIFFEAYVNANDQVVGWVARTSETVPYTFYRMGQPTGEGMTIGTRGTYLHAEQAVEAAVASVGIYPVRLPELTVQINRKGAK